MNVRRSIVYGAVGPCKTESSQKPVPMHPTLADTLMQWRKRCTYIKPEDWVFASKRYRGRRPYCNYLKSNGVGRHIWRSTEVEGSSIVPLMYPDPKLSVRA